MINVTNYDTRAAERLCGKCRQGEVGGAYTAMGRRLVEPALMRTLSDSCTCSVNGLVMPVAMKGSSVDFCKCQRVYIVNKSSDHYNYLPVCPDNGNDSVDDTMYTKEPDLIAIVKQNYAYYTL